MKTRTGKIARLPKPIRDQLNQRLDNGELATTLVEWLNQQPEVQKIVTDQFGGHPIRAQNLSRWRQGGFIEWTRHQLLREQTRWTAEQATDLESDTDERTMSIAEDIAMIMSAELALQVQALGAIEDPKEHFEKFLILAKELSRLRRDDQRAVRINHRREHWEYDHPKKQVSTVSAQEKPETFDPDPKRQRAGALQDAPRNPETSEPRASVPDCGSPLSSAASAKADLPLSQSEPKQENPIPNLEAANPQPDLSAIPSTIALAKSDELSATSSFCILSSALPPQSRPIPPTPTQNNSPAPEPTPLPTAPIPKRPFNPHRDYHDPYPPRRHRPSRCLEG